MFRQIFEFFTSLKLTAVLLALALVLVFAGTIAQVEQGLYQAQARYFKSLFVYWSPAGAGWGIPVFPGGYLLGGLMLLNLVAATGRRLRFTRDDFGLLLVHAGLILLFLGQLFTDLLSVESAMQLRVGDTKNYSEDFHANELVVVDTTDPGRDRVVAIPERLVAPRGELSVQSTPLTIAVRKYWRNADVLTKAAAGAEASGATEGIGKSLFLLAKPPSTKLEERNLPAAVLEIHAGSTNLGTWLVSSILAETQEFSYGGRTWQVAMRPTRHYTPFAITLVDCQHDVYPGTDLPKNFSSRVRVRNAESGEDREVLIYMNNPLRFGGNTYYQYQMAPREAAEKHSTLQVVRNPSWLTPYVSCALVGLGLVWQFLAHLIGFLKERRHEK